MDLQSNFASYEKFRRNFLNVYFKTSFDRTDTGLANVLHQMMVNRYSWMTCNSLAILTVCKLKGSLGSKLGFLCFSYVFTTNLLLRKVNNTDSLVNKFPVKLAISCCSESFVLTKEAYLRTVLFWLVFVADKMSGTLTFKIREIMRYLINI